MLYVLVEQGIVYDLLETQPVCCCQTGLNNCKMDLAAHGLDLCHSTVCLFVGSSNTRMHSCCSAALQVLLGVLSSFRPQLVLYDAGVDINCV
jgi:hypothetical protein